MKNKFVGPHAGLNENSYKSQVRNMIGRAFLTGPREYDISELEGSILDMAVGKAEGLEVVMYLVPNPHTEFYECCVLNSSGGLQHQYLPSRMWDHGGQIIDRESIEYVRCDDLTYKAKYSGSSEFIGFGETILIACMRCRAIHHFGKYVTM